MVGALTFAAVVLACLRTYSMVKRLVAQTDVFTAEVEDLLEKQQFDKAAALASAKTRERPNYAYGHWYLARACIRRASMSGYIDPYVREEERQMGSLPSRTE